MITVPAAQQIPDVYGIFTCVVNTFTLPVARPPASEAAPCLSCAAAAQVPPNLPVRKRLLDWKRLWWCCTVRARDICGVQKELRWVLGGAVLVGTSRWTISPPLSGLQLGALGLVSGEAGLLRCRSRRRSTGNGYSYEVCNPTCLKLPELLEYDVLVVCSGAWLPHRRQPASTPPHRRLQ